MERKHPAIHLFGSRLEADCENAVLAFFPLVPLFLSTPRRVMNDPVA